MKYITVAEYASIKRVSPLTVRAEISKGRIKAEKIGKEYRIPVSDAVFEDMVSTAMKRAAGDVSDIVDDLAAKGGYK